MGELSYELYLSHMLVVLGTVALYRAVMGASQAWAFAVYAPAVVACVLLAGVLEKTVSAPLLRRWRSSRSRPPSVSIAQVAGSSARTADGAADRA
jgi:peptidoglycan/LPS O-acetylase OafA/YrhL